MRIIIKEERISITVAIMKMVYVVCRNYNVYFRAKDNIYPISQITLRFYLIL